MATLTGSSGDDTFNASNGVTEGSDTIFGLEGFDTIHGLGGDDFLYGGGGPDILVGDAGADYLDGGDGNDYVSYLGSGSAVSVSLVAGGVGGDANGDTYFSIEYVMGSIFGDFIAGDGSDNALQGAAGNDHLKGNGGNDNLDGGDDSDWLEGGDGDDRLTGGSGNDQLEGGAGRDVFEPGSGQNTVSGGDGDDLVIVKGADTIDGGAGSDRASFYLYYFQNDATGLYIDLASGVVHDNGSLTGISLTSIEDIQGSEANDSVEGDVGNNLIDGYFGSDSVAGGGGDDTLYGSLGDDILGGGAGADKLDGGSGIDTADYQFGPAAIVIDLQAGTASGGDADGDVLIDIEDVHGTFFDDVLTGNAGENSLVGDIGNDRLTGGAGADRLYGGDGEDLASYADATGSISIDLAIGLLGGSDAQGDVLFSIEDLAGSSFGDTLMGDIGANVLLGGGGDDTLIGRDGNDTLGGGAGSDYLVGGKGQDTFTLTAGDGSDEMIDGGGGSDRLLVAGSINERGSFIRSIEEVEFDTASKTGGTVTFASTQFGPGLSNALHVDFGRASVSEIFRVITDTAQADLSGLTFEGFNLAGGDRIILQGSDAADMLVGTTVADTIQGQKGSDRITGGEGADSLAGGGGNDAFIYQSIADAGDTIADFSATAGNDDQLRFAGSAFGGLAAGLLSDTSFQSSTRATAASAGIRFFFETDTGILRFDADGSGSVSAPVIIATFQAGASVLANDIVIV